MFQHELKASLPGAEVHAVDSRPDLSVACQLADRAFALPPVDDDQYIPRLIALAQSRDIGLIVPTIDPELPVLSRHRSDFAEHGIAVLVSEPPLIDIFRDKRTTAEWFVQRGLKTAASVDPRAGRFPIFARPYDGSCSRDTHVIASAGELTHALLSDRRMMFVEYLSPQEYDEYTIDLYYAQPGELKCLVPRLRIETRAGEVSKGRTAWIEAFDQVGDRLSTIEGARGCLTLQLFVHRASHAVYGIEINPRFGGGYPLSYEAGANFPRWLVEEYLLGKPVESFHGWERGLTMLRYDDHIVVRGAAA